MARRMALILTTAAIFAALAAVAGVAGADPINSKNAQFFEFDCGGELVTVVTLFNNNAVVGNDVEATRNFVATRIAGTVTVTDAETGEIVEEDEFVDPIGKGGKKGIERSLITCTTTDSFEDPEEGTVVTVDLTLTGFFTPRRG